MLSAVALVIIRTIGQWFCIDFSRVVGVRPAKRKFNFDGR